MVDYVYDKAELIKPCEPVSSQEEGWEVCDRILDAYEDLINTLPEDTDVYGISANQIGIKKRVCMIVPHDTEKEIIFLMNPEIMGVSEEIEFEESCLSFPEETFKTKRYRSIVVGAMNHQEPVYFFGEGLSVVESIATQQHVDLMNGLTPHDKAISEDTDGQEEKDIGKTIFSPT